MRFKVMNKRKWEIIDKVLEVLVIWPGAIAMVIIHMVLGFYIVLGAAHLISKFFK